MKPISTRRRSLVFGAAALGITVPVRADLYDDFINSTSKKPFIAFLARKNAPVGHAFVGVGVRLKEDLKVFERFFGYYPDGQGKAITLKLIFSKTSGKLGQEFEDLSWTVSHEAFVTEEAKAEALAVADTWANNDPKYNLFANDGKNCNVFASEVAKSVGLKLPTESPGTTFPWVYIQKLKDANK